MKMKMKMMKMKMKMKVEDEDEDEEEEDEDDDEDDEEDYHNVLNRILLTNPCYFRFLLLSVFCFLSLCFGVCVCVF